MKVHSLHAFTHKRFTLKASQLRTGYVQLVLVCVVVIEPSNYVGCVFIILFKELTPEQKEYKATAAQFARKIIIPKAAHHDKTGEVLELINHFTLLFHCCWPAPQYPYEILKSAWELGLLNAGIPTEYGKRTYTFLCDSAMST